jgi:adenylate cyclase
MAVLFVCLTIPVLIFIMLYNYQKNAAAIAVTLDQAVGKTLQVSIENAENLINPVVGTLGCLRAWLAPIRRSSVAKRARTCSIER